MKKCIVDMFSRVISAELIRHGCVPCPKDLPESPDGALANRLPEGYGSSIGLKAWDRAMSVLDDPTRAEDVLMDVATRFCGSDYLAEKSRSVALNYVFMSVVNGAMMVLRGESRRPVLPFAPDTVLPSPDSTLGRDDLEALVDGLADIHPDAPLYMELSLQGLPDTEIIPLLPSFAGIDVSHNVWQRYKQRIKARVADILA